MGRCGGRTRRSESRTPKSDSVVVSTIKSMMPVCARLARTLSAAATYRRAHRRFFKSTRYDRAVNCFSIDSHTPCIAPCTQAFFIPLSPASTHSHTSKPMPSTSLNCFTPLPVVLLLGGISPAAGQNNVFTNRAALLVARDAWCADPTAAAAIYGPISLWDISQVTDLSWVFCADSYSNNRDCNPACASFNSDISGWDTSIVTTLSVRAASHPLHPSPLTRTRCASLLLTIRFAECRVLSKTRLPSTNPSRRGTSRGSQAYSYAPPLVLSPASPPPHHNAMASLLSPSFSPIGSSPPLSHTLSSSPPSGSTGRSTRSSTPTP